MLEMGCTAQELLFVVLVEMVQDNQEGAGRKFAASDFGLPAF